MTATKKMKNLNVEKFISDAKSYGWQTDRYGNLTKVLENGKTYRFNIKDNVCRYEVKVVSENGNRWIRLASGLLKNIRFIENGKVQNFERAR